MTSSDPRQEDPAAAYADDISVPAHHEVDDEAHNDDAWMEACRAELHDDDSDDSQNEAARADLSAEGAALQQTGDDAMSKFGHAIGALAENEDDLDDQVLDYAAEMASPSSARDEAVAPHIAAAERELERSKSAPVDIFDRIAQAAESQFDESRGSTAKRVSELVDDRRVGTKKWTPSKTMKQRMEKLEAARAAASGDQPVQAAEAVDTAAHAEVAETASATEAPVMAASAPSSAQATTVTPGKAEKPEPEAKAEEAPMTEEQSVTISRRDRQIDHEDSADADSTNDESTLADGEDHLDADGLRVVPGARGRRRDRARKSRLDEDFEKIFDDEGKPSINSLRRKLRSGAAEEEAAAAAAAAEEAAAATPGKRKKLSRSAAVTETAGADTSAEPKKGLFSRFLNAKKAKVAEATPEQEVDDLVAAFDSNDTPLDDDIHTEGLDDESWQDEIESERKKNQIAMPVIGAGAAILLGGLGWFGYKFLTGM